MPLGAFTIPSSRSVLTWSPALPGGRAGPPLPCWRLTRDSKGSRRACFNSLSAAAVRLTPEGLSTALAGGLAAPLPGRLDEDLAPGFAAGLAAGFAVCGAALPADVGAGLAGACVAGFAGGLVVCCAV